MEQAKFERLSAFIDGDPTGIAGGAVQALLSDQMLVDTWKRYHLIGDCLRRETADIDHDALTLSIHQRLAQEPTVLAPRVGRSHDHSRLGWARMAGGLAMAASVAAVVVLGVNRTEHSGNPLMSETGPVVSPEIVSTHAVNELAAIDSQEQQVVASKVNRYLADHSRFLASGGSLNGMLPLATLVGHNE